MTQLEQEYTKPSEVQFNQMHQLLQKLDSLMNATTALSFIIPLLSPYIPVEVVQRNVTDLYTYGFSIAFASLGVSKVINSETLAQFLFSQEFVDRE